MHRRLRFSARLVWPTLAVLMVLRVGLAPAAAPRPTAALAVAERGRPGRLVLEDKPERLKPVRARTDAEEDRLEALSLFSAARMLEEQERYAEALRLYQRALRYDPTAVTIARAIVPLAVRLERHAEAVRYAMKVVEMEDTDPMVLRRLGIYLTERGEWDKAVAMYEKAVAARRHVAKTAADVLLQMEMGRLYHLAGKYDKAAESFAQVLAAIADPGKYGVDEEVKGILLGEPGDTYNLIGESFLLAKRPEEAVQAFEKANQLEPDKGLLNYNLARVEAETGKPERALARLQVYFDERLSSEGTAPYRLLADLLARMNQKEELIGRLEKLRAADPANVPLGYFLAEQYHQAGQLDKAEPLFRELVAKTPTATGYRALVDIYRKTKRPEPLLDVLAEMVAKTGGLESLGEEAQTLSGDPELMKMLASTARAKLQAEPSGFGYESRLAVALAALQAGQHDVAAEFFELAMQAQPEQAGEVRLTWGLGLLIKEEYGRAAKVFQQAIDQKATADDEAVFQYYLAGALEMDGQTDAALAAARKAAELREDSPRFLSRVGWVLYHANRNEEAAKVYRELIEKYDSDHSSAEVRELLREARLVLSNIDVVAGRISQAEEWLEQVLDEFPDDVSAMNDLGYLWAEQNIHLHRAHAMIRQAVEAEPDNAAFRDSLGWVLFQLGRYDEAVRELEKAAVDDSDPVIFDHLGDAYWKVGQADKAREAWRRAVEEFTKANDAEKAKAVEAKIHKKP